MEEQKKTFKRKSALYAPLILILLSVGAILFLSMFFRVSIIQVENNTVYSDEEVLAASGLEKGVNLLFINNFTAVSSIYATMPYVESVSLKRIMPNHVILSVTGSEAVACVSFGDDYWLINANGKLLEKIDADHAEAFIRVESMEPLQPVAGEIMLVSQADAGKDEFLKTILEEFEYLGISGKVDWVDLADLNDPVFSYEDRFTVHLRSGENLRRRLALVQNAISQLAEGDAGLLELEADNSSTKVYFSPK